MTLAAVTVITESEIAWLFIAGGVINVSGSGATDIWQGRSLNAAVAAQLPAASGVLSGLDWPLLGQLGLFFAKAGAFVFGSGSGHRAVPLR